MVADTVLLIDTVLFIVGSCVDTVGSDRPERSTWWTFDHGGWSDPCRSSELCYWCIDTVVEFCFIYSTSVIIEDADDRRCVNIACWAYCYR